MLRGRVAWACARGPAPEIPRAVPVPPGRAQADVSVTPPDRCGAMILPSGRSSPVSSKSTTPLHSRLQPCSGWCATRRADSRSAESAEGHGGWCWHMGGFSRSVMTCVWAVVSLARRESSFMAAPRGDESGRDPVLPHGRGSAGISRHRSSQVHDASPARTVHPNCTVLSDGSQWPDGLVRTRVRPVARRVHPVARTGRRGAEEGGSGR